MSKPTTTAIQRDGGGAGSKWQRKLAAAEIKYKKNEADWEKYNGTLNGVSVQVPTVQSVSAIDSKGKLVFDKNGRQVFKSITTLAPVGSDYDLQKYQDLRGSARVEMDKAQADMDEAKKMVEEVIPDEARRAGAPPGWVR